MMTWRRVGGWGVAEIWHDDKGEGGVWLSPENDDVIYEQPLNITTLTLFPFNLTRKSVWRPSEVKNISLYDPVPIIFFLCMSFAQSFCFYLIDGTLTGLPHVRIAYWHCSFSKVATREIFLCNVSFQNCSLAIHEKLKICHTLPLFMHAAASIVAAT